MMVCLHVDGFGYRNQHHTVGSWQHMPAGLCDPYEFNAGGIRAQSVSIAADGPASEVLSFDIPNGARPVMFHHAQRCTTGYVYVYAVNANGEGQYQYHIDAQGGRVNMVGYPHVGCRIQEVANKLAGFAGG